MHPDQLDLLRACGSPAVHPDGHLAIVPITRPDLATDEYTGGLWAVATDGSTPPRPITRGHRDTAPAISPDGRWLAFLRAEPKGKPQVHVVAVDGGEPVRLTDHALGAGAPRWSPDSRRLAYSARVPEPGRYGTDADVGPDAEPPRLVTALQYRSDGVGYTRDRRQHVFVLDLPPEGLDSPDLVPATLAETLAPRQVTDGDHDDTDPVWSPDGALLAFVSDRHPDADRDLRRHAYVVAAPAPPRDHATLPRGAEHDHEEGGGAVPDGGDTQGGAPRQVSSGDLIVREVAFDTDGKRLVLRAGELGPQGLDFVARNEGLFVVGLGAAREQRRLTDAETIDLAETPAMTVTTRGVLVNDRARGAVRLLEVDPDGDVVDATTAVEVAGGHAVHRAHAATRDGAVVVSVVSCADSVGDLVVVRGPGLDAGATPRRLSDVSKALRDSGIRPLTELTIAGDDGYPVHGWAVLPDPAEFGPGPHPVLLNIHGGPYAGYGWGVFDEAQVYAGVGYAVLMCNPRGSAGYGQAHGRVIEGAFGGRDAADVLQFLDGALADASLPLDRERVGVMGGSYGGYLTALLTTRTNRFAAAVVERGYLDATTFIGSSDIGWFFASGYHGDARAMREQSPMTHVQQVRTPTLVIHSEADWRCPVEQGQRWFTALKLQGVETELLLFPGEGHELSRSGRPRHRRARFEHVLRWWASHLPVTPQTPR